MNYVQVMINTLLFQDGVYPFKNLGYKLFLLANMKRCFDLFVSSYNCSYTVVAPSK